MKLQAVQTLARLAVVVLLISLSFWLGFYFQATPAKKETKVTSIPKDEVRPWAKLPMQHIHARSRSITPDKDALLSLGYVDATYDSRSDLHDVIVHIPEKVWPGLNLYVSKGQDQAMLMDMMGTIVHTWRVPGLQFGHVHLFPNGDLLVLIQFDRLLKIDRNSNILWEFKVNGHHDFWVHTDGRIFLIGRTNVLRPEIHPETLVMEDRLIILSAQGRQQQEFSLLDLLEKSPYAFLLPSVSHWTKDQLASYGAIDVTHANHVEVFDRNSRPSTPWLKPGNVLVSFRNINSIVVIDPIMPEIVWLWGPTNLTFQHDPVLLKNGNLLIFDNGTSASRVLELNPITFNVVWQYNAGVSFFSALRGSNQRLPNGNTLITESDRGYVFEVTLAGEIVWRFANPDITPSSMRKVIWRMTRYAQKDLPFLSQLKSSP